MPRSPCTRSGCGRWTGSLLHPLIPQEKDKHLGLHTCTNRSHISVLVFAHSTYHFPDVYSEPSGLKCQRLVHQMQARHLPISSIFNMHKSMSMARQSCLNVFVIGSDCATSGQGDAQMGGASRRGAGGRRALSPQVADRFVVDLHRATSGTSGGAPRGIAAVGG
jgi:hypothetical protein